jgi:hypothetical protein
MRQQPVTILVSRSLAAIRLALALVLLHAFPSGPAAAQKFDLGPYFGPLPEVGDYKVFELSTGGTETQEVLAVVPEKEGFRITTRITETGLDTTFEEDLVIPGKATFLCDLDTADSSLDLKNPVMIYRFKAKPGKPNRIRGSGRAILEGALIGNAVLGGSWVFAGLEPLDTPAASYPDTAVIEGVLTITLKARRFGDVIRTREEMLSWQALGIGEVATHHRITSWLNGALVEDTGWTDEWLIDGSLGGEPIP